MVRHAELLFSGSQDYLIYVSLTYSANVQNGNVCHLAFAIGFFEYQRKIKIMLITT